MRITCLADVEEFEKVPFSDRWRGKNIYDFMCRSAEKFRDLPALKFQYTPDVEEQPTVITYDELAQKVRQTANALFAAGVSVGGTTSVLLPNLPEIHYTLWGAQALGIAGPINYMLEPAALLDILTESEAEAVVVLGPSPDFDIWEKAIEVFDQVPTLKLILQVNSLGLAANSSSRTEDGIPIIDFSTALAREDAEALVFDRQIDIEEVGIYFHTGGTTGTPKIAQISHRNQIHVASFKADFSGLTEESVGICGLPLFHVNAVYNTGLNFLACGGHAVYLTPKGYRSRQVIDNFWQLIAKYRGTMFNTVPTHIAALLERDMEGIDISSLKYVICGAAPISPEVFREFQDRTGANILEGYGLTEGTLSSSANPIHGEKRLGSIGIRSPYQQMKCVILDEKGSLVRDCEPNEVGVILIKGPNVFMGYKQAAANEGVFFDGWLITGDLARQDEDGYFYLVGRAKDLIIRGGHNIDPKGIEDTLTNHPAVALAAAVPQPDSYAGELPCAYVTLAEGFSGDRESLVTELLAFAKMHISERAAIPVHIEILEEMPLTAIGKIFKPDLQMRAIKRVLGSAVRTEVPEADIIVVKDDQRGSFAKVSVPNGPNQVERLGAARTVLDKFAVSYSLDIAVASQNIDSSPA